MIGDPYVRRGCYYPIYSVINRSPRAVILGHSMTRRMDTYLREQYRTQGYQPSIDQGIARTGVLAAEMMRLDYSFAEIDFRSCPFAYSYSHNADIDDEILALSALDPDIILISLGSNDLIFPDTDPTLLADRICEIADSIDTRRRARQFVFVSCLDRAAAPVNFSDRMEEFNNALESLCENRTDFLFYRIRGFSFDQSGNPLPVATWSDDGIHPSKEGKYFAKFAYEIRAALLAALPYFGFQLAFSMPCPPPSHVNFRGGPPPPPPPPPPAVPVA